jgi:murein DD-endopeptidase MepM/ murein hydrolase activator NlpD
MADTKPKKKIIRKLRNKFRLVIMNDDTFEEKASLVLSPLNVFIFVGSTILFLIVLLTYIIAFTGLREYIPGYADVNMRKNVVKLALKADSLEKELATRDMYFNNIKTIMSGGEIGTVDEQKDTTKQYDKLQVSATEQESELRAQVEALDKYSLSTGREKSSHSSISNVFFFTPLKGTLISSYDPAKAHYGVDIVAPKNEAIKATLDGTVILSTWTSETGYVIQIQHSNNLVSIYKHNSVLLKKAGERVKAGEVVAIIGDSGEITTGPHLHFELWYNGIAINPQDYMIFN